MSLRFNHSLLAGLLVCALTQIVAPTVRACQYCRLAATDPEAARMAAQMHSGGFPLEATINQFQGTAPAATLTVPPVPGSVTTTATDLPRRAALVARPAAAPVATKVPAVRATSPKATNAFSMNWANVGLLGLAAIGGWFYWRTRRDSAPVA